MSRFIIDGYNLIKTRSEFKEAVLAAARRDSIGLLQRAFSGSRTTEKQTTVLVVFDGQTDVVGPALSSKYVRVVFSKGEKADDYIKRFVQTHPSSQNLVVTNDRELTSVCRRSKAQVWTVDQFMSFLGKLLKREGSQSRVLSDPDASRITEYVADILRKKYAS